MTQTNEANEFWVSRWEETVRNSAALSVLIAFALFGNIVFQFDVQLGTDSPEFAILFASRIVVCLPVPVLVYLAFTNEPKLTALFSAQLVLVLAFSLSNSLAIYFSGTQGNSYLLQHYLSLLLALAVFQIPTRLAMISASISTLSLAAAWIAGGKQTGLGVTQIGLSGLLLIALLIFHKAAHKRRVAVFEKNREREEKEQEYVRELSETRQQLQKILTNLYETIYQTDADGLVVYASPSVERLLGYTPEDVIGTPLAALYKNPKSRDELLARLAANPGQFVSIESELIRKDGTTIWVETNTRLLLDENGHPAGVEGSTRDITEKHELNEKLIEYQETLESRVADRTKKLEASQSRFSQIITSTSQGYWRVDRDRIIQEVNPAMCRLLQCSEQEILGRKSSDFVATDNLATLDTQNKLRKKGLAAAYELTLKRPNGSTVPCIIHPSLLRNETGEVIGSMSLATDISDIKDANAELERARSVAETANEAKTSFLANMSHEIRTPMNGIIGMSELLSQTHLDDNQGQMLSTISDSANALLRIIDDVLDISKVEAGRMELASVEFQPVGLVEDVLRITRPLSDQSDVRMLFRADPDCMGRVRCDPVRLRQIILNLISNAIKFARPESGIRRVVIHLKRTPDGQFAFSIEDNGIGISEENQKKLFQAFSQAEASTTRRFGGTGLGLAISRGLAQRMGGDIIVHSELGVGSTFTAILPLEPVANSEPDIDFSGLTVFINRDAEYMPQPYVNLIRHYGGQFVSVEDPAEFRASIKSCTDQPIVILPRSDVKHLDDLNQPTTSGLTPRFLVFDYQDPGILPPLPDNALDIRAFPLFPNVFLEKISALAGRRKHIFTTAPAQTAATPDGDDARKCRILVVEDNPINLMVIERQLETLGYDHISAEDGIEGFRLWQAEPVTLVLTDLHMPNLDGYGLTRKIRDTETALGQPAIPIIALTANAMQGERENCLSNGMNDYLTKPLALNDLEKAIAHWAK